MKPLDLKERLAGVIAFAPTPFDERDELDRDGLARQVDFLVRAGASAVVVAGGVGEFYALDPGEHRAVVETAVQAAARRVPVLAGVGHSTRLAAGLAAAAAAAGADGVMVNPLYFVDADVDGLCAHFDAIGAASGLGSIAFRTRGAGYDLDTIVALAGLDSVVALKDEAGDLASFTRARELLGDELVWINGVAEALAAPYAAAGATAMTSGIVNFAPELALAVWAAAVEGRAAEAQRLVAERVRPIASLRERRRGYSTTVVKEAMNLRGLPGGRVRLPLVPLRPDERAELALALERLPALVAA